jgi:hypothetical protein
VLHAQLIVAFVVHTDLPWTQASLGFQPPGVNLDWSVTDPAEVKFKTIAAIAKSRTVMDKVAKVAAADASWVRTDCIAFS